MDVCDLFSRSAREDMREMLARRREYRASLLEREQYEFRLFEAMYLHANAALVEIENGFAYHVKNPELAHSCKTCAFYCAQLFEACYRDLCATLLESGVPVRDVCKRAFAVWRKYYDESVARGLYPPIVASGNAPCSAIAVWRTIVDVCRDAREARRKMIEKHEREQKEREGKRS